MKPATTKSNNIANVNAIVPDRATFLPPACYDGKSGGRPNYSCWRRAATLTGQHGFRKETSLCLARAFPEEAFSATRVRVSVAILRTRRLSDAPVGGADSASFSSTTLLASTTLSKASSIPAKASERVFSTFRFSSAMPRFTPSATLRTGLKLMHSLTQNYATLVSGVLIGLGNRTRQVQGPFPCRLT